ncbi:MAG: DUF1846 domain-containing protein, partial [Candidatus Flemingiibacterium sp.]
PIWNIPLKHPVNIAYEAATADLGDVNMIDPFHLDAYGVTAVNYNRDVEIFPVLNAMLEQILGVSPYKSPTDMGVNMAGNCIIDDEAVSVAAKKEIIRRYYTALCDVKKGKANPELVYKMELLMRQAGLDSDFRPVIKAALEKEKQTEAPAAAIELPDGSIVTGKTSELLGASSALLLNSLKQLAGIPDGHTLISHTIIEPISHLKVDHLGNLNPRLHIDELLIALSICSINSAEAELAMEQLDRLRGCDAHSTVILSERDVNTFKQLGVNLTCEPKYETKRLFNK